ncbi:hypothetical protein J5N97_016168 [Dioscorea zingiberensis]|uniref:Bifunctional inhibitor/plant lipid transfer protein/seed storage helical domain-containing protein n=1 Tax=Dioscorea zingiberensis TaxID=325984 RepID=A0A9D5CIW2_9LILI|nr:hypothetical protein J5N97_016168 [Dioscorea zingiberensis]
MAISSSLLNFSMLLVLGFIGTARSDFASDRAECTDQLVGLASCLSFVQSTDVETPTPTPDCCSDFKGVVGKSFKCLCVLIKDRDEPQLGIKVNVTRALMLPAKCNAPVNVTDCPRLLKVPLNSSEAKDFKQFADEIQGIGKSAQVKRNITLANENIDSNHSGARRMKLLQMEMLSEFLSRDGGRREKRRYEDGGTCLSSGGVTVKDRAEIWRRLGWRSGGNPKASRLGNDPEVSRSEIGRRSEGVAIGEIDRKFGCSSQVSDKDQDGLR